jgi:hypothetical protein
MACDEMDHDFPNQRADLWVTPSLPPFRGAQATGH